MDNNKPSDLFIDQEFRSLIPPLEASELRLLEESILEEGVRDALVIWNGYIVDGHNRYDIITRHGITDYRVIQKHFTDKDEVKIWIMKNQIGRRNITPYLRAEYYFQVAEWEEARKRAKAFKGNQYIESSFVNSQNTTRELSDSLNIGQQAASRIIQIHERAPDFIKEQCRSGDFSINQGYINLRQLETIAPKDRPRAIDLIETGQTPNIITARRIIQKEHVANITPPKGRYQILYADPPWQYEGGLDIHGAASRHYNTLTIDELCQLPIQEIADVNSALFLWVPSPKLEDCFKVINAWGFSYKASFVWDKVKHVMGEYNSVRHELLLLAIKGTYPKQSNTLIDSVITIERTNHSVKPSEFRRIIDEMYPQSQRIELFATDKEELAGWVYWGHNHHVDTGQ